MAVWLQEQEWKRFCTFTTGYQLTMPSARRLANRFFLRICDEVFPGEPLRFFYVVEKFECRDSFHLHGLLDYPETDRVWDPMKVMTESYQVVSGARKDGGWNRVSFSRYNRSRAAGKYCSKYLMKKFGDYDMLVPGANVDLRTGCSYEDWPVTVIPLLVFRYPLLKYFVSNTCYPLLGNWFSVTDICYPLPEHVFSVTPLLMF